MALVAVVVVLCVHLAGIDDAELFFSRDAITTVVDQSLKLHGIVFYFFLFCSCCLDLFICLLLFAFISFFLVYSEIAAAIFGAFHLSFKALCRPSITTMRKWRET